MRLLFVCTGNICRSPTADAVARSRVAGLGLDWTVDSAGTGGWHEGEAPDPRAIEAGARRGYDLASLRARAVEIADFTRFDHIIALDRGHERHLRRMAPSGTGAQISRLMVWAGPGVPLDVPDPYYDDGDAFTDVLDLVERGIDGFIAAHGGQGRQPSG